MKIIAYKFDGDIFCVECTENWIEQQVQDQELFIYPCEDTVVFYIDNYYDSDGNKLHPVFDTDEQPYKEHCGECEEEIDEDW